MAVGVEKIQGSVARLETWSIHATRFVRAEICVRIYIYHQQDNLAGAVQKP